LVLLIIPGYIKTKKLPLPEIIKWFNARCGIEFCWLRLREGRTMIRGVKVTEWLLKSTSISNPISPLGKYERFHFNFKTKVESLCWTKERNI
jgi:hypothetical protein